MVLTLTLAIILNPGGEWGDTDIDFSESEISINHVKEQEKVSSNAAPHRLRLCPHDTSNTLLPFA